MSQQYYKIAKQNYLAGQWNKNMLDRLLQLGKLTQAEYDDIINSK